MNIVLIGAGGFLGDRLLKSFLSSTIDHELRVLSSSLSSNADFKVSHYHWPESSLSDDTYKEIFCNADSIIYAAGAGIQPGNNADEESVYALNLHEPARLVESLSSSGFKGQFISFGSYFESGIDQPGEPLDEKVFVEQNNPLPNAYCNAKKKFTALHRSHENTKQQFHWLHLILTNIYGPGENKNRLIPYIISESQLKKPLHFTKGRQVRQYTFIDDIVFVVQSLVGKVSGIYHVTNKETVSIKDIILETVRQVEKNLQIKPELHFDLPGRRDTEMDYLAVNPEKLYKEWGLACTTNYQQGINFYFDK
jgi:nucleoside-diphosphate-sugar epimerase